MVMLSKKWIETQTRGTDTARNDSFGYNDRSELTSATLGNDNYAYNFDNIGNRMTAEELSDEIAYSANNLNQYTAIEKNSGTPFVPTFDDDGNQLTVQTATGVWNVTYNAENRPVIFTQGTTVIECKYDSQGRRFEKKVTVNGTVTFWQRYVYKGYLQIAAFDVSIVDESENYTLATTTYWDPTEPTATRPLAFTDHTVATPATYFYTHDLTKNVCEVLSRNGTAVSIVTTYDYTPFGAVTSSNSSTPNTFMFSSEVLDPETALVYYNYRHYNPTDGRWLSRDPIGEDKTWLNLYAICKNLFPAISDLLGLQGRLFTSEDFGMTRNDIESQIMQQQIKERERQRRINELTQDFNRWYDAESKKLYNKDGSFKKTAWIRFLVPCPDEITVTNIKRCMVIPGSVVFIPITVLGYDRRIWSEGLFLISRAINIIRAAYMNCVAQHRLSVDTEINVFMIVMAS